VESVIQQPKLCLPRPVLTAKNASILRMLFEAGAQMAVQDRHGRTPLYLACAMNRTECAAYLCEVSRGCNTTAIRLKWVT
jgi:ankyrin repeat protein